MPVVCSVSLPLDARGSAELPSPGNNRTAPLPVNPRGPTFAGLSCPRPIHLLHPLPTHPCHVTPGSHMFYGSIPHLRGQTIRTMTANTTSSISFVSRWHLGLGRGPPPPPAPKAAPEWPAPGSRGLVGTAQWAQPKDARARAPCVGPVGPGGLSVSVTGCRDSVTLYVGDNACPGGPR